ncbi:Helix-turn-helix type 11 domain protein [Beutenbergia cavernae DSM 12333]|uniref:Helix-turn-helix type 11 domain protein n=1 Tax=Beutenbergia cavernae (strain ATCC BAA-8 / DSM 12333 / CCUG 43141 / JCM 11478 / NBRC 16432 / NCIMB 13614 / HKI 0122) TaxID=471853 RepID=C5BZ18_BEUC1|nr:WYL domain-containing protein [Beutenbergia cavernae]ACQ81133.1 Helix-turn-helix type 11 domain protein [Beutenbergia cavernae DSM 12333]
MISTSARLLRLLALLQDRRTTTAPVLAGRLGVTERTVRRDVEKLRELGYPVTSRAGADGGYGLGAGGALPPLLLSEEEAVAVAIGLRLATSAGLRGLDDEAVRTLARLEPLLPAPARERLRTLHAATLTLGEPETVDVDLLVALAQARRDACEVRFTYVRPEKAESRRRVEPHRLVRGGRRWYLVARDVDAASWRTFRVDRMRELTVTTWRFTPSEPPEPADVMVSRGVSTAPYPVQVRVRFEVPRAVLADLVPPTVGVIDDDGAHACVLTTGAGSALALGMHLADLGLPFRVLSPDDVATRLHAAAELLLAATAPA